MIQPVVLSGGSGTRLWPLSQKDMPKHLIPLFDQETLLQKTQQRLDGLPGVLPAVVVCNEVQRFMVAQQLAEIDRKPATILLEPIARNTAPAVALGALKAMEQGGDPVLLVLAADHMIQQVDLFQESVLNALSYAEAGHLVTFGIVPARPHTGYGYIQRANKVGSHAYQVAQFVEKPSFEKAQAYLKKGHYYWNSGMFLFKASAYLEALKQYAPEVLTHCQKAMSHLKVEADFTWLDKVCFSDCPDISIDYAVMEKAKNVVVVPMDAGWSDVGSWESLWEVSMQDAQQNVLKGDVLIEKVSGSYIRSESRTVAVIGLQDVIIVETSDAVLVAHKQHTQAVKNIAQILESRKVK